MQKHKHSQTISSIFLIKHKLLRRLILAPSKSNLSEWTQIFNNNTIFNKTPFRKILLCILSNKCTTSTKESTRISNINSKNLQLLFLLIICNMINNLCIECHPSKQTSNPMINLTTFHSISNNNQWILTSMKIITWYKMKISSLISSKWWILITWTSTIT